MTISLGVARDSLREGMQEAGVDSAEIPALVEEAVYKLHGVAGAVVGRELTERGFPVVEPVVLPIRFTLPHGGRRIAVNTCVVIAPLDDALGMEPSDAR